MNAELFKSRVAPGDEPIPGYRLIEPLGSGGYGEVWKVSAPGGVSKAIKLIFDDHPSRSTMELRSLNRIKDVRHPFLLSIDRIEQRPGLLAIVTELADRNLVQHCQAYREKGFPGIPQHELLAMLHDVADVLDYIYQEFALQHLDIKAANLLVFGKRLKAGDFGLVKNIYERSTTLVEGMTPAYAAPEIFAGKPTGSSDQYSLAIVYQEMLTGVLPFAETSPGRLAMQHLHAVPNLQSLPEIQQPIIARALSKDPQLRFSSCTALIEELMAAVQRSGATEKLPVGQPSPLRDQPSKVGLRAEPASLSSTHRKPTTSREGQVAQREANATESVSAVPPCQDDHIAPTIVIGIGGTAAHLLQQVRQRITDRLGTADEVPAIKLMLIDTDSETLDLVNRDRASWNGLEAIAAPLQPAAVYRDQAQKHRRWLSRRWLFNIPRNLRTGGLRPLGRLALVSNSSRVKTALRAAVKQMATVEASCLGGRRVAGPPRILFVTSISGGTGSGMVLDLAYAARAELQLAGFNQGTVDALLLHSTPVGTERDKAILNAVATLRELGHYGMPGKCYPGEPLLDVPPFHGNNRTFSHTQLMHLGDDLDQAAWLQAIDNAAEFVFARLATPRSQLAPQSSPNLSDAATMNVVQVRQIGGYSGRFIHNLIQQLCGEMVNGWCGTPVSTLTGSNTSQNATRLFQTILQCDESNRYQQFADSAATRVQEIGVDLEQLVGCAREKLGQELTSSEPDFLKSMFQQALQTKGKTDISEPDLAALVLSLQDRAIGLDFGERPSDSSRNTLFDLLHSRLASHAMQLSAKLTGWIHELVDHPDAGVEAARYAAEASRNYLHDLTGTVAKELREIHRKQIESRILLTSQAQAAESQKSGRWWSLRGGQNFAQLEQRLVTHGLLCFQELVLACVQLQLQSIEAQAAAVIDKLLYFGHELKHFGKRFQTESEDSKETNDGSEYEQSLRQLLVTHRSRLVLELRRRIDQDVLKGPKKLQRFLQQQGSLEQHLLAPLQYHARQIVLRSMRQVLLILLQQGKTSVDEAQLDLDSVLAAHLQEPLTLGTKVGEQIQVVVPSEASVAKVERRLESVGYHIHAVSAPSNNIAVCRESVGNSLFDLVQQIAHHQSALIQLADTLCSRMDVAWEPLNPGDTPNPTAEVPNDFLDGAGEIPGTLCLSDANAD